jgi:hypothetical protein
MWQFAKPAPLGRAKKQNTQAKKGKNNVVSNSSTIQHIKSGSTTAQCNVCHRSQIQSVILRPGCAGIFSYPGTGKQVFAFSVSFHRASLLHSASSAAQ